MKTIYLILSLCCFISWSIAQQPTYKIVGGDFLAESDVYSLLQDTKDNIWIATDKGLFKYNGYDYVAYKNDALKNNSLFGLTLDNEGTVFCFNFSGQILKIEDDSLHVHYQVPDSLLSNSLFIQFDNLNQLVISSKHFFLLDKEKKIQIIYDLSESKSTIRPSYLVKNKHDALAFVIDNNHEVGYFKDNQLRKITPSFANNIGGHYQIFTNKKEEVAVLINKATVFRNQAKKWLPIPISNEAEINGVGANCFLTQNNQLWFAAYNRGVYVNDITGKPLWGGKKLFPQYRISALLEDKEGNLWLGTFRKGLLFIPNLAVNDFAQDALLKDKDIRSLALGKNGTAYLGSQGGDLFEIDANHQVKRLIENYKLSIEKLIYFEENNHLFFNGAWLDLKAKDKTAVNPETYYPSVKDFQKVNEKEVIVATNIGLYYLSFDSSAKKINKALGALFGESELTKTLIYKSGRTNCVYFDTLRQEIWAGTSSGLLLINKDGAQKIERDGQPLLSHSITAYQNQIYIGSKEGILIYENGILKSSLKVVDGLLSDDIKMIKVQGDYLFVASHQGFQRLDLRTKAFLNFNTSDGLLSNQILDFETRDTNVWLLTSKGLQLVNLERLNQSTVKTQLEFIQIKCNDTVISPSLQGVFDFKENKVSFEFVAKKYRNKKHLVYYYKLEGLNNTWERTSYDKNKVVYNALPPGSYTFLLKIKGEDEKQPEIISYSFSIALPYWRSWWFVLLCVLFLGLLMTLFFVIRIRILKRENSLLFEKQAIEKELVESRQTALRSQMNPHFLFNALNSIQEMIMVNEKREAGKYLGKFADLMRIYLNHSRQNKIKLSDELEALGLYLELEKVRFEDSLTIEWHVEEKLNSDFILIPSMLIQPYVENALKHGLLHKGKDRQLRLSFETDTSTNYLICIIEDNGVGRAASAKINQMRDNNHQSFSTSATQKRLELLNYNNPKPIHIETIDLENEEGTALGTKVRIAIPMD